MVVELGVWVCMSEILSVFETGTLWEGARSDGTMGGCANTFQVPFKEAVACGVRSFFVLENVFSSSNFLHFNWG